MQDAIRFQRIPDLCFHAGSSVLLLTHGFVKKTQKTPSKEIEKAEICKRGLPQEAQAP